VVVGERADVKTIEVPALRKLPSSEPLQGAAAPQQEAAQAGGGAQRAAGLAIGAVGVVALGVGVGFGIHALSRDGTANTLCGSATTCMAGRNQSMGLDATHDAVTSSKVADGLLFGGAALVGVGLTVALTAKTGPQKPTAARQTELLVGPSRVGLALRF
jgi:hypothetical protein